MRLEVVDSGPRRRFTLAEKERIVAESMSGPRMVSATARRYGVAKGLLFTWRKAAREGRLGAAVTAPGFQPALICDAAPAIEAREEVRMAAGSAGRMEIVLVSGARIIVDACVDAGALARVIKAVERS
jgi:transposase